MPYSFCDRWTNGRNPIDPNKISHINYAFVDVKDNRAFLRNEKTDTINFRLLNELKKVNKDLKILISLGGWTWSKNFSDAVLTDTSNPNFSQSSVDIVAKYDWRQQCLSPGR